MLESKLSKPVLAVWFPYRPTTATIVAIAAARRLLLVARGHDVASTAISTCLDRARLGTVAPLLLPRKLPRQLLHLSSQ
eukprot:COSAG06_NODE_4067_length_4609_cov_2.836364_5_plen_79_part_00